MLCTPTTETQLLLHRTKVFCLYFLEVFCSDNSYKCVAQDTYFHSILRCYESQCSLELYAGKRQKRAVHDRNMVGSLFRCSANRMLPIMVWNSTQGDVTIAASPSPGYQ